MLCGFASPPSRSPLTTVTSDSTHCPRFCSLQLAAYLCLSATSGVASLYLVLLSRARSHLAASHFILLLYSLSSTHPSFYSAAGGKISHGSAHAVTPYDIPSADRQSVRAEANSSRYAITVGLRSVIHGYPRQ